MEISLKIKWFAVGALALAIVIALPFFLVPRKHADLEFPGPETADRLFDVQAIDTMKFSRDRAREALNDRSFDSKIDTQMKLIKESGATHAAIGTPYDDEFTPAMERWVKSARSHGLSVWFRGNFSGWEGWFDYPQISKEEHREMLSEFIENNPDLFADGDLFSPCPECENGKEGDPRDDDDAEEFNRFLKDEHEAAKDAFDSIDKEVLVVHSMNADVARDILGDSMYKNLDGSILVDHYVKTPEQFISDIRALRGAIGENVGIGEFGAPIPDLQGGLSEADQSSYIERMLRGLYGFRDRVAIVNYWTLKEGTTAIVDDSDRTKASYKTVQDYFSPLVLSGKVTDSRQKGLDRVVIKISETGYIRQTDDSGAYRVLVPRNMKEIVFSREGYKDARFVIDPQKGHATRDVMLEEI